MNGEFIRIRKILIKEQCNKKNSKKKFFKEKFVNKWGRFYPNKKLTRKTDV